ncbi:YkvA family protein [Bacilliculturomica massiliensis]|uniref:YkvA family protein n=1 Tax=Bacilliculturomica massiliensis TaxID=1917867 RepID=UPI00102F92E7|nr:YkvA family protein [Bacilliculturomica massiliensis]
MQFISLAVLGKRIKAIKYMMKDKNVSFWKKALVVLGLIYLILPVDLIPPIIPVFGFLDDLILWLFILYYLRDELDKYWTGEDAGKRDRDLKKKYRGKNIVDGVEYEVREEEDDSREPGDDEKKE